MMHPPVSPGNNVFVNGGKPSSSAAAGSELASIDAIPQTDKKTLDGRPAETVGNCIDEKNRAAGMVTQSKDAGVQKPDPPNGKPPPRNSTNISDIRFPPAETNGGATSKS